MTSRSSMLRPASLGLVLVAVATSLVHATHDEPGRGRAFRGTLVTAYEACTAPNTTTGGGFPVPACAPPVRSDAACGFGALQGTFGAGKVKAVVRDGDMELAASLSGLGLGCEGRRLCGVIEFRVTTDRCAQGSCTAQDLRLTNESATACCVVTQGNCRLKTSVNTEYFDALRMGERAGVEVLSCGLRRVDGEGAPPAGRLTFVCGMLSP